MDGGAQQGIVHGAANESNMIATKQQQIEAPLKLPFIEQAIKAEEVKKLVQS